MTIPSQSWSFQHAHDIQISLFTEWSMPSNMVCMWYTVCQFLQALNKPSMNPTYHHICGLILVHLWFHSCIHWFNSWEIGHEWLLPSPESRQSECHSGTVVLASCIPFLIRLSSVSSKPDFDTNVSIPLLRPFMLCQQNDLPQNDNSTPPFSSTPSYDAWLQLRDDVEAAVHQRP